MSQKRTLWEVLTGKRPLPTEMGYFNPLQARIGSIMSFLHEPELTDIDFPVEKIWVVQTSNGGDNCMFTDYALSGVATHLKKPLKFKLRTARDPDASNDAKCQLQLLHLYDQFEWDEEFFNYCNRPIYRVDGEPDDLCFCIREDDEGNPLSDPPKFWRIGEGLKRDVERDSVLDPWYAKATLLSDRNLDGEVDESEVQQSTMTYWDFSRVTHNDNDQEIIEYLIVEMDNAKRFFRLFRGVDVELFQVLVRTPDKT